MLYINRSRNESLSHVSVRSLSRSNKSKLERAAIAAAILDDRLAVSGLTVAQLAMLCGTTASAISKHRARRGGGRRKQTLAERLRRASRAELAEAARAVGADAIWDALIVPAIDAR